jgi:hypothetical protein
MDLFTTKLSRFAPFFVALLLNLAPPLLAQVNFGRISGAVSDASGAVVPGIKIRILNEGTGVERTVMSNESGDYVATNLAIGVYTVKLEAPGFQPVSRTGLNLVADGRLTVDFTLQPASASQSVEVTAAIGEAVNTVSGEI